MYRILKSLALTLFAAVVLAAGITQAQQRTAEAALRAAVETEMTQGVNAAIEQYKRVADTYGRSDPATAAQALLRLAEAYEKTGSSQATTIYEKIVREFAAQGDAAAIARRKLNNQGNATAIAPAPRMHQVWAPSGYDQVSVDGRYMPYPDWLGNGMGIRDLVTGTDRLLHTGEVGETIVISPDNSQIVYQYFNGNTPGRPKPWHYVLRLVSLAPNAKPRDLMRNNPSQYIEPAGWTPDGKQVLVTQQAEDKIWQIAMVSVANGTSRVLKSLKWGGINARISPDGRFVAYSAPVEGSANSQNDIYIVAADGSTHAVAVDHPANDYGMVWSSDGSKLLFLSLRTGAPSLWMIPVKEGKAAGEAQLVKPNFDSRLLGMSRDGRLYYLAGTSAQNIYRAEVDPDGKVSKAPVVATDSFVNVNRGGQISPDGQRIAYYSYRPQPVIVVKSLLTGEERVIPASLNFRSVYFLGPRWFADGNSVLVDATENDRPDTHHYRIDLATGRVEEILRGLQGEQFTPAPFGNVVYYRSGTVGLMRHDLDTGISTRILPPEPIALQFTVSRDGKQLAFMTVVDGMKIYSVIAAAGGEPREVYRLPSSDGPDRFNALEWSPDQKYLILVVADEGVSPFRERNSLWRVKVEGGSAERLGVTMSGRFKSPFLHPNGKQLFFTSIRTDSELWALENFLTATPRP